MDICFYLRYLGVILIRKRNFETHIQNITWFCHVLSESTWHYMVPHSIPQSFMNIHRASYIDFRPDSGFPAWDFLGPITSCHLSLSQPWSDTLVLNCFCYSW